MKAGATWITAYKEAFPAKGLRNGFNSCAPSVIAWRVDQASKVAAPDDAMARPVQSRWLKRFSARNSLTDTVVGLIGFAKISAMGAGASTAEAALRASGSE